jgi:hypothetical protein
MSKDERNIGCFAFLSGAAKKKAPEPPPQTRLMVETRRLSQSIRPKSASESESDFMMRLQGFDDTQIEEVKAAKMKRISQDMEAQRKSQEEAFHKRLQG